MLANVPRPGRDFDGLCRYLLQGQAGAAGDPDRVAWVATRNLATDRPDLAAKVMKATADLSVRVERPAYHLIISWHPDERPTREAMIQVAETTLADIGLSEHQALLIGHKDSSNLHLHAMINRVHPETGVAWSTSHDYPRIERSMRRQAEAQGFIPVPGRHTEPERFKDCALTPARGEYQLLRKKGRAAVLQWSMAQTKALGERLKGTFDEAQSWDEVEQALEAFGGELVAKGQGLVITDRARSGYAKLSALRASIRLKELEARFGQTWGAHRTDQPRQSREHGGTRPLVTEMDVVLGLYRAGLAKRADVEAVADERERRMAEAPVAVQIEREMRQALRAAVSKPRKRTRQARAGPRRKDREPEPTK